MAGDIGGDGGRKPVPRLLYLADVSVQGTYHGSAAVYRLLEDYPPERLLIVETSFERSSPDRRLPGVRYETLRLRGGRLRNTRLHVWASSWFSLRAGARAGRVQPLLHDFEPEAVLTVTHGYTWLTAAAFAKARNLPLHLILHDDWPRVAWLRKSLEGWKERRFGEVYRQAVSRFCVSPYMAEEYERRYRAPGSVLYPARAKDVPAFLGPPPPVEGARPFTVGYAGSLATTDYVRRLATVARWLRISGGRLILFGPADPDQLAKQGLVGDNIVLGGFRPSWADLVHQLRAEADVLLVPSSFAPHDAGPMALNFPSKLTDYTATGLPLLIWGPARSSAARWAIEAGISTLVTENDEEAIGTVLQRMIDVPEWRFELGTNSAAAGERYFSAGRARKIFRSGLMNAPNSVR